MTGHFNASELLQVFRRKVAGATDLPRQEANAFIADYVAGLEGYTYLEGEVPVEMPAAGNGAGGPLPPTASTVNGQQSTGTAVPSATGA